MANTTNKVLAGWYSGFKIGFSANKEWAYIIRPNGEYVFFNKLNVLKIEDVSSLHTDASLLDTTITTGVLGVGAGMATAQGTKSRIKQVTWKNGETSLIEIDANVEKAIIVGMYQDITEEKEKAVYAAEKQAKNNFATGVYWVLLFGYILSYIYAYLIT